MRFLTTPNFNFLKWRWHAIALSVIVIMAGVVTVVARGGLPLGVDFSGGTVIVVQFTQPTGEDRVRNALGAMSSDASVQRFGPAANNATLIRLPLEPGADQANALSAVSERVEQALRSANIGQFTVINRELVGSTIGRDLQQKGIWATLTAIGGILVYIAIRFRFGF